MMSELKWLLFLRKLGLASCFLPYEANERNLVKKVFPSFSSLFFPSARAIKEKEEETTTETPREKYIWK